MSSSTDKETPVSDAEELQQLICDTYISPQNITDRTDVPLPSEDADVPISTGFNSSNSETDAGSSFTKLWSTNAPTAWFYPGVTKSFSSIIVSGPDNAERKTCTNTILQYWIANLEGYSCNHPSECDRIIVTHTTDESSLQELYDACLEEHKDVAAHIQNRFKTWLKKVWTLDDPSSPLISPDVEDKRTASSPSRCLVIVGAEYTDENVPESLLLLLRDAASFGLTIILTSSDPSSLPSCFFDHINSVCFLNSDRQTISKCAYYMHADRPSLTDPGVVLMHKQLVAYFASPRTSAGEHLVLTRHDHGQGHGEPLTLFAAQLETWPSFAEAAGPQLNSLISGEGQRLRH